MTDELGRRKALSRHGQIPMIGIHRRVPQIPGNRFARFRKFRNLSIAAAIVCVIAAVSVFIWRSQYLKSRAALISEDKAQDFGPGAPKRGGVDLLSHP